MQMVTKDQNVLRVGYLPMAEMAKLVGLKPNSFKTWVHLNKDKIEYHVIGHTAFVGVVSVLNAREHIQSRAN